MGSGKQGQRWLNLRQHGLYTPSAVAYTVAVYISWRERIEPRHVRRSVVFFIEQTGEIQ